MICKNCKNKKEYHYVGIKTNRKKMLKNVILWCYPLSNLIKPEDERYFMKFALENKSESQGGKK